MGRTKYEPISRRDVDEDDEDEEMGAGTAGVSTNSFSTSATSPQTVFRDDQFDVQRSGGGGGGGVSVSFDSDGLSPQKKKTFFQAAIFTTMLILLYFTLSIGLTFYQSSLFEVNMKLQAIDGSAYGRVLSGQCGIISTVIATTAIEFWL